MQGNDENKRKKLDTVLCIEDSGFWKITFSDIMKLNNVVTIDSKRRWKGIKSELIKSICRIWHSSRVNSIIKLPFKSIWNHYDYVYNLEDSIERWIFTDTSIRGYDSISVDHLKRKGIKLYILLLNPVISAYETDYAMKLIRQGYFECVYTVDSADARKYGFIYTNFVYSKKEIISNSSRWKISYVGTAKNRLDEIHNIAAILQETKSIFYVSGVSENKKMALNNLVYNHPMEYEDVLQIVQKSDCILEVVQPGQTGFTFRTYEALCYNKKLLTNNQDIKNQPFYDPRFIRVFNTIDKSLLDFVDNDVSPDYQYTNQYSPLKLFDDIIKREKNDTNK